MAHILVVDDTRNIRKMVELALKQDGHHVEVAEDGARALEAFGTGEGWDLVVVDQQMPSATGREVIVEARRRDPSARLIMMTAFATHELASQVLAAGAMDFLRKPFTADVLRGAVQAALAQPLQETQEPASSTCETPSSVVTPGVARTSWRVNGWSFWPLDGAPRPASAPASLEFGKVFTVRGPLGNTSACFVGVTAHIREQSGHSAAEDEFWEAMCAQSLLNFLWEKAAKPPGVLPLFEMPHASPRSGQGLIRWGPFAG
jgi:DNA-binding response OmpR family regulator